MERYDHRAVRFYSAFIEVFIIVSPLLVVVAPRIMGSVPIVLGLLALMFSFFLCCMSLRLAVILLIFPILGWIGMLWSPLPDIAIDRVIKLTLFTAAAIGMLSFLPLLRAHYRGWVEKGLPVTLGLAAGLLAFEYAYDYPFNRLIHATPVEDSLPVSILNRPYIILTFFIWPVCAWLVRNQKKHMAVGLFFLLGISCLYTWTSQSAMLGVFSGVVGWGCVYFLKRYAIHFVFGVIALGTLLSPWIAHGLYQWRPDRLVDMRVAAAAQRITIWQATAIEIQNRPVVGHGLEATRTLRDKMTRHTTQYPWKDIYHPHNFALQLWLDLGLVGVLAFFGLLYQIYCKILTDPPASHFASLSCLAAVMSIMAVGYGLWQSWLLGSLIFTVVVVDLMSTDLQRINQAAAGH